MGNPGTQQTLIDGVADPSPRALAARERAQARWSVYPLLCRSGSIYTGIALNVAARYAQHVAGVGARYTRANPPVRLLVTFTCSSQSEAARMESAIKNLSSVDKRALVGKTTRQARRVLDRTLER